MSELDRWLTPERIARSDFMQVVFDGVRSGAWDVDGAQRLAFAALCGFGNGSCYFLASVVADVTGGTVAGFWRRTGDDRLVHAVVVDPRDGHAADILGRRPLAAVREELEQAAGPLRTSVLPSIRHEMDDEEAECLVEIAAGLPWMQIGRDPLEPDRWMRVVTGYVEARQDARNRA